LAAETVSQLYETHQHVAAARCAQVEREAALVAVHRGHPGAAEVRAEVLAVQGLDLDHVGAHVAQDLAGGGAGDDLREVENERVGQRQHAMELLRSGTLASRRRPAQALRFAGWHLLWSRRLLPGVSA
jgi:hypothetical protein